MPHDDRLEVFFTGVHVCLTTPPRLMTNHPPFRYSKTSPEATRLAVMLYVRFPLSLRNVEDLLHERGVGVSHEKVWFWWSYQK